jgi:UDP-GlcNAc3NAcA epimerase
MKIVTIIGARPQFIKAATVSRAIRLYNNKNSVDDIQEVILHTGQHFDEKMSQIFFDEMQIPAPNYNLNINSMSHGAMTGRMLEGIETILLQEEPDWVLVYGDTNSTLAGALAASKLHIKVAHVEAGLRSFNMTMPEEINRILTDRISNVLFSPTETALKNLRKEGFPNKLSTDNVQLITNVGDVMFDAALFYSDKSKKPDFIKEENFAKKFILATVHRQENTDNPGKLKEIFEAFYQISKDIPIVLPLHPRTKKIIHNLKFKIPNLYIIDPVSYLEMIWLLRNCSFVMTDSGGLQKEAYFFKKPCITLREETEWVELVDEGVNFVVGSSKSRVLDSYNSMHEQILNFDHKPYGDGKAAEIIVNVLLENR